MERAAALEALADALLARMCRVEELTLRESFRESTELSPAYLPALARLLAGRDGAALTGVNIKFAVRGRVGGGHRACVRRAAPHGAEESATGKRGADGAERSRAASSGCGQPAAAPVLLDRRGRRWLRNLFLVEVSSAQAECHAIDARQARAPSIIS